MFDEATLRQLWPRGDSRVPGLIAGIAAAAPIVFPKYNLNSPVVIAQAMAQFSHECGAGTEMVENINYTPERAVQVWPSRFGSVADVYTTVKSFPGDPEFHTKLMDSVYGNRMGNRPGTHDGSDFIGRGLSQVTGRENYEKLSGATGLDLLNHPNLVSAPTNALECGVADFIMCGCLPYAEKDDIDNVTLRLNGGHIGLAERKAWLTKWKRALAQPQQGAIAVKKEVAPNVEHGAAVAIGTATVAVATKTATSPAATPTHNYDAIAVLLGGAIICGAVFFAIRQSRSKTP